MLLSSNCTATVRADARLSLLMPLRLARVNNTCTWLCSRRGSAGVAGYINEIDSRPGTATAVRKPRGPLLPAAPAPPLCTHQQPSQTAGCHLDRYHSRTGAAAVRSARAGFERQRLLKIECRLECRSLAACTGPRLGTRHCARTVGTTRVPCPSQW